MRARTWRDLNIVRDRRNIWNLERNTNLQVGKKALEEGESMQYHRG